MIMNSTTQYIEMIENAVRNSLPELSEETRHISEMLMYSLESGGKRVRPLLCLEFCKAAGGDPEKAVKFALAVEFIHTYSLCTTTFPAWITTI